MVISAVLVLLAPAVADAQFSQQLPLVAGDTLVNADTLTKRLPVTDGYAKMFIQLNYKKISGASATGKAYLYRSGDGGNYYQLVDSASWTAVPTGTMFNSTVTHTAQFDVAAPGGDYYLVNMISSGTVSAQVRLSYTFRRYARN